VTRVFVTGGSGVIGRPLLERLAERGDDVMGLARSEEAAAVVRRSGARAVSADLLDIEALARDMSGCQLVYHVAGVNALCVDDPDEMWHTNVDGAATVIHAAARAGVPRVVYTSSAATIGEPAGAIGREDTEHRGWFLSTYERTKTEGERRALEAGSETGVEVVSVNPSSVQGPGRAGGTGRILLAFLDGRLRLFVDTRVSLIDIADCIEGHLLAAQRGRAGERYILNGMTFTVREALRMAAEVAGVRRRLVFVPAGVATVAASAVERGFRLVRREPPVCPEMVRTLLHGHRYDGSRAERELGLRYTPARDTLQRTIEWGRSAGLLRNV
jgi:dihydroflavonol-4-reductase